MQVLGYYIWKRQIWFYSVLIMERFLFFRVDNLRCGIPFEDALTMIRMVGLIPYSGMDKGIAGSINLHGEILPAYSIRYLFGLRDRQPLLSDNLIIVKKGLSKVALWVDETHIVEHKEIEVESRFVSEHIQTIIPGIRIIKSDLFILFDLIDFLESGNNSPTKVTDILGIKTDDYSTDYSPADMRDYSLDVKELEKRAYNLSLPEEQTEKTPLIMVIRFNLMYQEYAIEMNYIREVIQTSEITPVPGTPDFIAGICSVRGEIISLVDLRILLSIPEKGLTDLNRVIVLSDNDNTFGILADQITGIGTIDSDEIERCENECNSIWQQYCSGAIGSLIVLNAASLLADPRMIIDDSEA